MVIAADATTAQETIDLRFPAARQDSQAKNNEKAWMQATTAHQAGLRYA